MPTEDVGAPQFETLSIIIPVYNERKTVMQLLQQVAQQPVSLRKELIIVDDCSTDGTREFLQQADLQQVLSNNGANAIKLALHEKNMGKGAGVRTGLAQATGDIVLVQDADLEYDPGDYPVLLAPILEGHADAVFGNRFHSGSHRVPRYYRYSVQPGLFPHLQPAHRDRHSRRDRLLQGVSSRSARTYESPLRPLQRRNRDDR